MTFRASSIDTANAYKIIKGTANQVRINVPPANAQMQANGATYEDLRDTYNFILNSKDQINLLKTTPGLEQYAKDQENDPTYDIVAEFNTMLTAMDSVLTWMDVNIPVANRTLKAPADWGEGTIVSDSFTPAQTVGLQTELTALEATIS
jgi:hypothetical protein